ncbi:thioredoxin [Candidatus Saccharibacteria bacterium]|nr:thioredoxin [Candidatus Saccharibacteria bacterium]
MGVLEGKAENFDEIVKDSTVLVDFNADWCGPCQILKPVIEEFAEEAREVKVVSVNIDDEEELAEKFGVEGIPCLVVLKNGEEVTRSVGVIPKKKIEKLLEKAK